VDGRVPRFRLIGINNQNFVMADEETGTWWQQVTGRALFGPLTGKGLELVFHEELAFRTLRQETRVARVLRPEPHMAQAGKYAAADWEARMALRPVPHAPADIDGLPPRTLVVGIEVGGVSRAYRLDRLRQSRVILDQLDVTPVAVSVAVSVVVWLGPDDRTVRVFDRTVDGRVLELVADEGGRLRDLSTGSVWSFSGEAVEGPLAGARLQKIYFLLEYWFDWKTYHPDTTIQR
jgi:hypothetical protein